jgi:hypothetical protein
MKDFRISGRVIDRNTKQSVAGLRIDAMDKDLIVKTPVSSTVTDAQGVFLIEISKNQIKELFAGRGTILFFRVFRDKELIASTEESDLWNRDKPDEEVTIKLKSAPSASETGSPFVVRVSVRQKKGSAFKGATVRLFGTGTGPEKLLGTTNTDDDGQCEIKYSPGEFAVNLNSNARVIIRVFDNKANLLTASPAFVASPEENIQLSVDTGPELNRVSGLVRDGSGKLMSDHIVRLFGRNTAAGNERLLGQAITNSEGRYFIQYDPAEFKVNIEDTNRLVILVFNKSDQLLDPPSPLFRASPEEAVDMILSKPLVSEYERYLQQLTPRLQNKELADLADGDVTALAGQTGIARQHVEFLRRAAQLARQTALQPEVFYGFARQGWPLVLEALLARTLDDMRAALLAAIAENIIPSRLRDLLDGIMRRLDELKRSQSSSDPKDLEACRQQLNQTQQALATAEQNQALLRRTLQEREQFIRDQQVLISELQKRINGLEEIIRETGQRATIEPMRLGTALGDAVDAIQQGLTNLHNRFVDYGLQELDLQTQVNLQVSNDGHLLIRFPGLNEQVAPQNLSQLQLRLRPIPKSQQNQDGKSETGRQTI